MNILICGMGALGTVFGVLLKDAGHSVFGLAKDRQLSALQGKKLAVTGIWGGHEAVLDQVESSIEPLRSVNFDLVVLTVKSYDTAEAIAELKPLVGRNTLVMVAQNGYGNYETVARAVGKEHALLARVIFGVKLLALASAEVTVIADAVRIGQPDNAVPEAQVREVAAVINSAGIPAEYAANITAILWDKILYNAALNPLGALLECTYGQLAENQDSRLLMDRVIDEIFLVAGAQGISLNWRSAEDYRVHFYGRLVPPTAVHYPSMYHDMKAGKRLEIDALNGAIVRLAREQGVSVPANEVIVRLIRAKEALHRI
ncbi:MAG: ketopantoate reductase family protein [Nitrospirota bacterium]|nr:ketopantoate reductase family protein [Nitrospirota bacterium]